MSGKSLPSYTHQWFCSCLPVSKVECLLQLPSLDLVFSTPWTDIDNSLVQNKPDTPPPVQKSRGK